MREQIERSKVALEQEKHELGTDLETVQGARIESEKFRKQAELKLIELQHSLDEHTRNKDTIDQQLSKVCSR
jgi:chromosome segregation ATPase